MLVVLSRFVEWRPLLTIVCPDTFVRWHREAFDYSGAGSHADWVGREYQSNSSSSSPTWPRPTARRVRSGSRRSSGSSSVCRVAADGSSLRPRTRRGQMTQSWATFLRNHAGAVLACDFFVVVTATFQRVYVFVILDIATRRVLHWNVTAHPTAEWTIQQFRDGLPLDGASRLLVHDRDGIFAPAVDEALRSMSLRVLKTRSARHKRTRTVNDSLGPLGVSASIGSFRSTNRTCGGCGRSG
jgi:putative transposase